MKTIKINYKGKLFTQARLCDSFFSQARGLMFSKKLKENDSILLPTSQSLTMLFVFFPIDMMFMNEEKVIVDIKSVYPSQLFINSLKHYVYVLELPKGKSHILKIGDKLDF